ncbi:MAG: hypothetical protein QOH80_2103 [Actinomycetota bacterium]|nr:hypothetical protein [Actinomycetota bacterium]
MTPDGAPVVGFRCDAVARTGVGHLVRCIALSEELVSRGVGVVFLGDLETLPWAARQLVARSLRAVPVRNDSEALADMVTALGLSAVVLDGYDLDPNSGAALRARGVVVVALLDGTFGAAQEADVYVDQNLGAERPGAAAPEATVLAGLDFVLLRDVVRSRRALLPSAPEPAADRLRVLAVFGGTDSHDAAVRIVPLLLSTGAAMTVTVVAGRPGAAETLRSLPLGPGQELAVTPPVDDLPALVTQSDLVISAAGTSVWELLCLGAATAVVCVSDNQEVGYAQLAAEDLAAPLGRLSELEQDEAARDEATRVLGRLAVDPTARLELSDRGRSRVDGRGRERVADALLRLSDPSPRGR